MSTSDYSYSVLRAYQRRADALLADPDVSRDLLAVGMSLLDTVVLRRWQDETGGARVRNIAHRAFGTSTLLDPVRHLAHVLRDDARRYDPLVDAGHGHAASCTAPMVRRDGPCGMGAGASWLYRDPDTGRSRWVAACSRHRAWHREEVRRLKAYTERRRAEQKDPPRPAANAGGVLARHLPELDWPQLWAWARPGWEPSPEEAVPAFDRPRLRLLDGGLA